MAKSKTKSGAIVADPGVANMHAEHLAWKREHALWRDELRIWQTEMKQVAKEIKYLEAAINDREKIMRTHGGAFRLDDQTLSKHEHALARSIQGDDRVDLAAIARDHRLQKAKHSARSREHAAISRQQHRLVARWRAIMKAIA